MQGLGRGARHQSAGGAGLQGTWSRSKNSASVGGQRLAGQDFEQVPEVVAAVEGDPLDLRAAKHLNRQCM